MARSTVLPVATYPAGTRLIGPVVLQNNLSQLVVEVQRCTTADPTIWPSSTARLHAVWEQQTGGTSAPWTRLFTGEDWGGISVHSKTGEEMPLARFDMAFFPGTQRRLRCTLTLDEDIRTSVVVDVM